MIRSPPICCQTGRSRPIDDSQQRPPRRHVSAPLPRRLFLLRELVKRDFQGRYAGSILGLLWSFIQPLWLLLLFSFVFATVLEIPLVGQRTDNFGLFLLAGLLPWLAINEGLQRAATAITDNSQLVKKLAFPTEVLVAAVVLAALLHECIALTVFAVVLAGLGELAFTSMHLLVLAMALQLVLTFGLGLLLSGIHVFFRDVGQILGMVLGGWFYFTPIVYPLSLVPERYRPLVEANPLTPLVEMYRAALLGGDSGLPPGTVSLSFVSLLVLALGTLTFRRIRPALVDEI